MAIAAHDLSSVDLIQSESQRRISEPNAEDFGDHIRTYRGFLKGVGLFVAHLALILILMAYFLL